MHVDADGYAGIPEGTHVHGMSGHVHDGASDHGRAPDQGHAGDPDHEGDHDVSIVELGAGASKLIFLAWAWLGLVIVLGHAGKTLAPTFAPQPVSRRDRWRPPLRAPPLYSR